jgi:hypothetical protein
LTLLRPAIVTPPGNDGEEGVGLPVDDPNSSIIIVQVNLLL